MPAEIDERQPVTPGQQAGSRQPEGMVSRRGMQQDYIRPSSHRGEKQPRSVAFDMQAALLKSLIRIISDLQHKSFDRPRFSSELRMPHERLGE